MDFTPVPSGGSDPCIAAVALRGVAVKGVLPAPPPNCLAAPLARGFAVNPPLPPARMSVSCVILKLQGGKRDTRFTLLDCLPGWPVESDFRWRRPLDDQPRLPVLVDLIDLLIAAGKDRHLSRPRRDPCRRPAWVPCASSKAASSFAAARGR